MIKNGKGGGNTKTGLVFEGKTDLATFLNDQNGYRVVGDIVFYNNLLTTNYFIQKNCYLDKNYLVKHLRIEFIK